MFARVTAPIHFVLFNFVFISHRNTPFKVVPMLAAKTEPNVVCLGQIADTG